MATRGQRGTSGKRAIQRGVSSVRMQGHGKSHEAEDSQGGIPDRQAGTGRDDGGAWDPGEQEGSGEGVRCGNASDQRVDHGACKDSAEGAAHEDAVDLMSNVELVLDRQEPAQQSGHPGVLAHVDKGSAHGNQEETREGVS